MLNFIKNNMRVFFPAIIFIAIMLSGLGVFREELFFIDVQPNWDFAANDILIYYAKTLDLLHGNYSRIGFYHPGPYYLQLMAVSEIIFYDNLRLLASPYAAHLFLTLGLSALSLSFIGYLFYRLTESANEAAIATGVFCVILYAVINNFIVTAWPPYLYVVSSVGIVASLGLMARYGLNWLPAFIFFSMCLIHGHASFIGIVPIIAVVFFCQYWFFRERLAKCHSFNPIFVVALSIIIITAFAVPVLINTFTNFPGELPKYFKYVSQPQKKSLIGLIEYLGDYNSIKSYALIYIVGVIAGFTIYIGLLQKSVSSQIASNLALVSIIVFNSGLVAVSVYALKGVDSFEYRYLVFWFYPYVAFLLAMFFLVLTRYNKLYGIIAVALFLIFAYTIHSRPQNSIEDNHYVAEQRQGIDVKDRYLNAIIKIRTYANNNDFPVVVYVDKLNDHGTSWHEMLTLLSIINRSESLSTTICVAPDSWWISYTEKYKCSSKVMEGKHPSVFLTTKRSNSEHEIAGLFYYLGNGDIRNAYFYPAQKN